MTDHIETPLHHVKASGSAHSGTHHWWLMKLSSLALIPLALWFFFSLMCMIARPMEYAAVLAWVQKPHNALLLSILFATNFYHAALGGQEVIIDYVHKPAAQRCLLTLYNLFCLAAALVGIAAVLYIFFKL